MLKTVIRAYGLALCVCVGVASLAEPAAADAGVSSLRELLSEQFRSSQRVTFVKVHPSAEQRARIQERTGRPLEKADYTVYVAMTGDRVDGYALFDEERGQHELISFVTFFDGQGHITRVEIVTYREPYGDGIRAERFRKQFVGRHAQSGFRPNADVDAVGGATISSRSMCIGVQRASVLLDETVLAQRTMLASRAAGHADNRVQ